MKALILSIIISATILNCFAQSNVTALKGRIVDSITLEPLSFANIYLSNRIIGCASDFKGNFELRLEKTEINDTLIISYLGYKSQRIAVNCLRSGENYTIRLVPDLISIAEFNVISQRTNLKKLLNNVNRKFYSNLYNDEYIFRTYYRKFYSTKGRYFKSREFIIDFLMEDIKKIKGIDDYKTCVVNARTLGKESAVSNLSYIYNNGWSHWANNTITLKEKNCRLDTILFLDNDPIYVIQIKDDNGSFNNLINMTYGKKTPEQIETILKSNEEFIASYYYINLNDKALIRREWYHSLDTLDPGYYKNPYASSYAYWSTSFKKIGDKYFPDEIVMDELRGYYKYYGKYYPLNFIEEMEVYEIITEDSIIDSRRNTFFDYDDVWKTIIMNEYVDYQNEYWDSLKIVYKDDLFMKVKGDINEYQSRDSTIDH